MVLWDHELAPRGDVGSLSPSFSEWLVQRVLLRTQE
jgi:hypothetical protein